MSPKCGSGRKQSHKDYVRTLFCSWNPQLTRPPMGSHYAVLVVDDWREHDAFEGLWRGELTTALSDEASHVYSLDGVWFWSCQGKRWVGNSALDKVTTPLPTDMPRGRPCRPRAGHRPPKRTIRRDVRIQVGHRQRQRRHDFS